MPKSDLYRAGQWDRREYLSDRRIRLITTESLVPPVRYLTVESYMKWYAMYIVDQNTGTARRVDWLEYSCMENWPGIPNIWSDHCIVPKAFTAIAKHLGVFPCDIAYETIVGRFLNDVLDGQVEHLPQYLEPDTCCLYVDPESKY